MEKGIVEDRRAHLRDPQQWQRKILKFIPRRFVSGIIPNSLWLLDSSTYVSSFVSLALNECHYFVSEAWVSLSASLISRSATLRGYHGDLRYPPPAAG
jgi:hypothetical protein